MRPSTLIQTVCLSTMFVLPACDSGEASKDNKKVEEKSNTTAPAPAVNVQVGESAKVQANPNGAAVVRDGAGNEVVTDEHGSAVRDGAGNEVVTDEHGASAVKAADGSEVVTDSKGNVTIKSADGKSISVDADGNVKMD